MTDCSNARMRDALPDLLHDRLTPGARAECAAHVAECADCAAELALLRSARASLDRAPALDVAAIVRALPAPTRVALVPPSIRRGGWSRSARWRAAAGVALVAGGAWFAASNAGAPPSGALPGPTLAAGESARSAAPATATGPASAGGANAVERAEPAGPSTSGLGVSVADLSDDELEAVFRVMDGGDALPSVDPLPTITPIGAEGDA